MGGSESDPKRRWYMRMPLLAVFGLILAGLGIWIPYYTQQQWLCRDLHQSIEVAEKSISEKDEQLSNLQARRNALLKISAGRLDRSLAAMAYDQAIDAEREAKDALSSILEARNKVLRDFGKHFFADVSDKEWHDTAHGRESANDIWARYLTDSGYPDLTVDRNTLAAKLIRSWPTCKLNTNRDRSLCYGKIFGLDKWVLRPPRTLAGLHDMEMGLRTVIEDLSVWRTNNKPLELALSPSAESALAAHKDQERNSTAKLDKISDTLAQLERDIAVERAELGARRQRWRQEECKL